MTLMLLGSTVVWLVADRLAAMASTTFSRLAAPIGLLQMATR